MTGCKLDDANLRFTNCERVRLEDCSLARADLTGMTMKAGAVVDCDLRAGDVTKAKLTGTRLTGSKIEGLQGAGALRGVVIGTEQVLPLALAIFADHHITIDDDG
jgi:uncharacterized protein YjbI with pentapeptide repeats